MQTLDDYGPEFYVEFKVRIIKDPKSTWTNILHVTKGGNQGQGNRLPAIWLHKNKFFHFMTSANSNSKYGNDFHGVELNKDYHIVVSQQYNTKKELIYTIVVNGKVFHSVQNTKPVSISPALLYLSDPWYASINDIGKLSQITVIPGKIPSLLISHLNIKIILTERIIQKT